MTLFKRACSKKNVRSTQMPSSSRYSNAAAIDVVSSVSRAIETSGRTGKLTVMFRGNRPGTTFVQFFWNPTRRSWHWKFALEEGANRSTRPPTWVRAYLRKYTDVITDVRRDGAAVYSAYGTGTDPLHEKAATVIQRAWRTQQSKKKKRRA